MKYLKQIEVAETRKMDIYFSPSLEVENKANKNGLTISAVGDPEDPEFYIFYKRPISVVKKQFFRIHFVYAVLFRRMLVAGVISLYLLVPIIFLRKEFFKNFYLWKLLSF